MSWTMERLEEVVRVLAGQVSHQSPSCESCRESEHEHCDGRAFDYDLDQQVVCRCFLSFTHDHPANAADAEDEPDAATTCVGCGLVDPAGHADVIIGGDAADTLGIHELGRLPLCAGCERRIANTWADPRVALVDALALVQELHGLLDTARLTVEETCNIDARVEEMRRRVEAATGTEDPRS